MPSNECTMMKEAQPKATKKKIYDADRCGSPFKPNDRIKKLIDRRNLITQNHKKDLYCDNAEFLIYHWSGKSETFAAASGENAAPVEERINIGDHSCRVDAGGPFPYLDQMPSKVNGYEPTVGNWAEDYAFFLRHSEAIVHPHEQIVGEFHWQLDEARSYKYPAPHAELGLKARELGAGGFSLAHTCPDLSIGLELGWGGLLEKVRASKKKHAGFENLKAVEYLEASEKIVLAIIDFVKRHSENAKQLAASTQDPDLKESYETVAKICANIAENPPATYHEALQWIMLYMIVERINGPATDMVGLTNF
jgi:formate C-acetyltransferase